MFSILAAALLVAPDLHTVTRHLSNKREGYWEAARDYPEFKSQSPVAKLANKSIADAARDSLNDFVRNNKESFDGKDPIPKPDNPYASDWSASIEIARPNLISVVFDGYEDAGGAHPNHLYLCLSFGIVRGAPKELALQDLLKPGLNAKKVFSSIVIPALKKKGASNVMSRDIKELDEQLMKDFTISKKEIDFHFAPYEVASYAEGPFDVEIPFSKLKRKLDPKGPLAGVLK